MPENHLHEWTKILLSGLGSAVAGAVIGAIIGALIAFFIANRQIKTMIKLNEKTIKHQNEMLQATFENGVNMLAFERSLDIRLRFLSEIYDHLSVSHSKAYIPAHQIRNSWRDIIRIQGKEKLVTEIRGIQGAISDSVVGFVKILNNYAYFDDLRAKFQDTLQFQKNVSGPTEIFIDSLKRLPEKPEEKMFAFIEPKAKDFSRAVDEFDNWLSGTKSLVIEEQKKIFERKKSIFPG